MIRAPCSFYMWSLMGVNYLISCVAVQKLGTRNLHSPLSTLKQETKLSLSLSLSLTRMASEEGEVVFDEVKLWLPSQVLDEAYGTNKEHSRSFQQNNHHSRHRLQFPAQQLPPDSRRSSPRPQHRTKSIQNRTAGGLGMQAIFLDSGPKAGGTGVFLPQRAGTNSHPSKKPACAPVLLPSRVVQALNLNVQAIGLQVSPRQDLNKNNSRKGEDKISVLLKNKKGKDVTPQQCCVIPQNRNTSPELYLPKEWTY